MDGRDPQVFTLNRGQTYTGDFGDGRERTVALAVVETVTGPFFCQGRWHDIFLYARVRVAVDGVAAELLCAPYALPRVVNGLQIQADLVHGVEGGLDAVDLSGDACFSALAAGLPWCRRTLNFPVEGYRWRASNYAHTWNGFVHAQADGVIYYHRGEDYGAIPDRCELRALHEGTVVKRPPPGGDGDSNEIAVEGLGWVTRYYHMNAPSIRADLAEGRFVRRGERLALTGNTWDGGSVTDPHLHVGVERAQDGLRLNTYPLLAEAYRRQHPDEPLAVAGGYAFCREGESVTLSGLFSLPPAGGALRFAWRCCDGTVHDGPVLQKTYPRAGTYTEELWVTDDRGRTAADTVIVLVSRGGCELPFAWFNAWPARPVAPGAAVEFLFDSRNLQDAVIDYGDGPQVPCPRVSRHRYERPGDYTVTVAGTGPQGVPGVFKLWVRVEDA